VERVLGGIVNLPWMKRTAYIVLGLALLAWAVLAIVLDSPSLELLSGSATSPGCLPATLGRTATLPGTSVDVSPAPGTGTAAPRTQISFLGTPAAQIRGVSVVGSRSGTHSGRLQAYSQGDGASFEPGTPFQDGEQVTVHAIIGTAAAGRPVAFRFGVDTPYPTASISSFPNPKAAAPDTQSFYTMPGAEAPVLTVTSADRDPAAGDVLTTNGPGPGQYGPLIYTPQGRLVWFGRLTGGDVAENLSEQTYHGARVLTWWKGRVLSVGFGQGEDVVTDSSYRTVARVAGGNGLRADLHDFQIAGGDVAFITAYNPIRCDLAAVKGSRSGAIVDTAIQEIDMRTGLVRWEWHSLDHVGVAESEVATPTDSSPWDWFHLNSIDAQPDGRILISARSTWASYQLAGGSGTILWRLGGNHSSFKMGPGTKTAWQHDARLLGNGDVTLFDDGANPPIESQSRAVRVRLDLRAREARLISSYTHDPPLLAASQGNVQTLAGGTLVGYGGVPQISEFAHDGSLLFDSHQPDDMSFYRAFRFPWSGLPLTSPAVLASLNNTGEETIVHASWNGATGVASWRVLAGSSRSSLTVQATFAADRFESSTTLTRRYGYVAVVALDAAGRALGSSSPVGVITYADAFTRAGSAG
jgi:Arylsulfotransferase (ASST)